jgi:NAD(P)-dependent dehydrogenase (short-subunit alcohol dehydrogenase family)
MRFTNKIVLITGGGTGIGAAVAQRVAAEGGKVALMGRRREPLESVAAPLGGLAIAGDAANTSDVRNTIAQIKETWGGLDVLVANAGGHGTGTALETTDESWALATHLNLDTAFVCARESLPSLIERKGNIVIVSSLAGVFAGPGVAGYVTMKHALIGLTRSLARDYGPQGVRVNAVCPAWVRTAMADEQMDVLVQKLKLNSVDEAYALVTSDVPLRRPGTPEEIANLIGFLASGEASILTGAYFMADGGSSCVDLPTLAFGREV